MGTSFCKTFNPLGLICNELNPNNLDRPPDINETINIRKTETNFERKWLLLGTYVNTWLKACAFDGTNNIEIPLNSKTYNIFTLCIESTSNINVNRAILWIFYHLAHEGMKTLGKLTNLFEMKKGCKFQEFTNNNELLIKSNTEINEMKMVIMKYKKVSEKLTFINMNQFI